MAKNTSGATDTIRDAIQAFVKSPDEGHYPPEKRREVTSKPYQELAGDRNLPVEIHRALATSPKKGVLYSLLAETRFTWEELKSIYDQLGATEEAKIRILRNPVTPVEFVLASRDDPSPRVAEVLFGSPQMPVSEFSSLVEEYGKVCGEMESLFPGVSHYTSRNLSPRWEELRQRRYWLEDSANKWCARHENPVAVIEAVNQSTANKEGYPLRRAAHTTAKRDDVTWDMVKEHSIDWKAPVATTYLSSLTHKVPVADRAAVVAGRIPSTAHARLQCLDSSWGKFKPKKMRRMIKLYNQMLEEQGEEDLLTGIQNSFLSFARYWEGELKFSSSDDSPVETFFYENLDPVVTYNLGFVSFPRFLKCMEEDAEKVARVKELKGKDDEESKKEFRRLDSILLRSAQQRTETKMRDILKTEEGETAWRNWLRTSSAYPELAEVPYEWALEVLI